MTDSVRLLPRPAEPVNDLATLLEQRRSIRRLVDGPVGQETLTRLGEAVQRTPAAFNLAPWHVVIVRDERAAFWDVIEAGFRAGLSEDRLERYLDRLAGFRDGAGAILIYEDQTVLPKLRDAWQISESQAHAFVQQGIGMVQLALWLALTNDGLATSLQHWDWLVEARLAEFTGIPTDRFKLSAIMPIGFPAEPPRAIERPAVHQVVSFDRYTSMNGSGA